MHTQSRAHADSTHLSLRRRRQFATRLPCAGSLPLATLRAPSAVLHTLPSTRSCPPQHCARAQHKQRKHKRNKCGSVLQLRMQSAGTSPQFIFMFIAKENGQQQQSTRGQGCHGSCKHHHLQPTTAHGQGERAAAVHKRPGLAAIAHAGTTVHDDNVHACSTPD